MTTDENIILLWIKIVLVFSTPHSAKSLLFFLYIIVM